MSAMKNNNYSRKVTTFRGKEVKVKGTLVGYGALIEAMDIQAPLPERLALIGERHNRIETEEWIILTPRYLPEDTLAGHLIFALKYEGVDLQILKEVFTTTGEKGILEIIANEPTGQYARRIWFFYEWLLSKKLPIDDLKVGNYVDVLDDKLQFAGPSVNSSRHRVRNNLPGVREFCPLVRKTPRLQEYIDLELRNVVLEALAPIRRDVLIRAASFLMLADSKATYAIEGERPPQNRLQRWGKAIGQAGRNDLSKDELLRLQKIVIKDSRFVKYGWRDQDGFVGEHDRETAMPLPEHISARWQDVESLVDGLLAMDEKLRDSDFDPVIAATLIAFGFVIIHPFVDGNGRLHRYLIHHVLIKKGFTDGNFVFPVSSAILDRIADYSKVLQGYSYPRLELIKWKSTPDNNVEVENDTIDLYRYFDATKMAEFLFECVLETINTVIPREVDYLGKYDEFRKRIEYHFDMPEKMISLLVKFLQQGDGRLSNRAVKNEFSKLTGVEVQQIEKWYDEIFSQ